MRGLYPASLPVNEGFIKHTILLIIIESIPASVGLFVAGATIGMRQSQKRSASHNHVAQHDDAMDIDEQILSDVASLRASAWQASGVQPFEDTHRHADGIQTFIVLDSNVLISYLPLVREILTTISRQALKMALCLPSVVVAELNFLKERNASPNMRALAQEANTFLLAQVRSRSGRLRGQQKHEHLEDVHHVPRVNDDQIVDYCQYLLSIVQERMGAVCLLSNDQNCCLKAELQGIMTISPKPRANAEAILSSIMQKAADPKSASHVSSPIIPSNHTASMQNDTLVTKNHAGPSIEGFMDVDDDAHAMFTSTSHPLSQLHSQLINHLADILPHLAYDAALIEQGRRNPEKSSPSQASQKQSALYTSIHAPKGEERVQSMRAFIMPTQENVQLWKPLDCIHFALEFPPVAEKISRSHRPPSIAKLKLFLLAHDQPGGRRGKDWSVGDWKQSLEELDQVASFCGWQSIHECVEICRCQLSGSGLHI